MFLISDFSSFFDILSTVIFGFQFVLNLLFLTTTFLQAVSEITASLVLIGNTVELLITLFEKTNPSVERAETIELSKTLKTQYKVTRWNI